ncbi:uncharacterized protein BN801_01120 [Mycoplasma sp. CAG:877]|nr:uncharacterized protein BN801_01120 [Mycoplasma sp. CAG:877]
MQESSEKEKIIKASMIILAIAIVLFLTKETELDSKSFSLSYKSINIKNISTVEIAEKMGYQDANVYTETNKTKTEVVETPQTQEPEKVSNPVVIQQPTWRLPVERGTISSWPRYNHVALDITSPRGVYETIYPVADGVISGIYTDGYGGKVLTIHHVINGINYTSQYVHFSSYAPNLYVGKPVTINDSIGQMGATGWATGIHLHVTVLDCSLFNDANCSDTGKFLRYANRRYSEGFYGLSSLMQVPYSWYSR